MTRRLALAAFAAALLVAVFLVVRPRSTYESSEAADPAPRETSLVPGSELASAPSSGGRAQPTEEVARREPRASEEPASAPAPENVVRLSGRLLSVRDGRPVSDMSLLFRGERTARVTTDADGRFATAPVFAPGLVRVSLGTASDPRFDGEPARLVPSAFEIPASAAATGDHAFELSLAEPDAVVSVLVLREGRPAFCWLRWTSRTTGTTTTDFSGRAEIAFTALVPGDRITLQATEEGLQSERVQLVFPWPSETVVLELVPTGTVVARVVDAEGRALPDRAVAVGEEREVTDEEGRARLTVRAGAHEVRLLGESTSRAVDVPSGASVEVELVSAAVLVAAGVVVAEDGESPLRGAGVTATAPGLTARVTTDRDGRFEIRVPIAVPPDEIRVSPGGGVTADAFEPEEARVPFGSADLRFHRVGPLDVLELRVALLEARSGEGLERAALVLYRTRAVYSRASYGSRGGVFRCPVRGHDDLVLAARAIGYRERTLTWSELEPPARAGTLLSIALEPGFELELEVWSKVSSSPLAGATLLADGVPFATTDTAGRARLVGAAWPQTIRVEAPGHAPRELSAREMLTERTLELDAP